MEVVETGTAAVIPPVVETPHEGGESPDWGAINEAIEQDELETVEGNVEVIAAPAVVETPAAIVEPIAAPAPTPPAAPSWTPPAPPAFDQAAWEAEQQANLNTLYALTEEEARQMQTEPELVLPGLLARMHMNATKAALESMRQVVPQVVDSSAKAIQAETEARSVFFGVNDDLAKPEYESAVLRIAAMYRQVNPTAPRDEAVKVIGDMTRVALGLPAKSAAGVSQPPAVPTPFTPIRGASGASVPQAKNEWAKLADEFADDD